MDSEGAVCSSSSNESVIEANDDIYTEESDEEGGVVLVPRKPSSGHGGESLNSDPVSSGLALNSVFCTTYLHPCCRLSTVYSSSCQVVHVILLNL